MPSSFKRLLWTPNTPRTAAGFVDDNFAVVDLRRGRRGFALASSALTPLRPGLVTPSFDSPNIGAAGELRELVVQTAEAAGLSGKKQWSVALPEGAARTLVITLESKPAGRNELNEVLSWKIERLISTPASELRTSIQRLSPAAGQERYLVTVAQDDVVSEYEAIFEATGWHAGVLLPRHMGEAQWLIWDNQPGDKMLVSTNRMGFTSVVVRNGEPVLVRSYACEPGMRIDELHRFALYYRERLSSSTQESAMIALLVIGGMDRAEATRAIQDALEVSPRSLDPSQFGFDLGGEPITFDQLAGAAGMASMAWQ